MTLPKLTEGCVCGNDTLVLVGPDKIPVCLEHFQTYLEMVKRAVRHPDVHVRRNPAEGGGR